MKKSFLVFIFSLTVFFILSTIVKAEIHTGGDWIGIFPVNEDDGPTYNFGGAINDKWTNCTPHVLPVPTSPTPASLSPCSFSTPANPGLYHFRMEANDKFTPIAISSPFWVSFAITSATVGCSGSIPNVTLNWPYIFGVDPSDPSGLDYFEVSRATSLAGPWKMIAKITSGNTYNIPNSYPDNNELVLGTTYYYHIQVFSFYSGSAIPFLQSTNDIPATPLACVGSNAWLKTTSGDVHSNDHITTSGGPQ